MSPWLIALIAAGVIVLLAAVVFFAAYSGVSRRRTLVQESWHELDVELRRRHDLVPNLVETMQGRGGVGEEPLETVMRSRNAAMAASGPMEAARTEGELTRAVGRLLSLAHARPDVAGDPTFAALGTELAGTEDKIAAARRSYNAHVRDLNTAAGKFPGSLAAKMLGVERAEHFEADEASHQVPNGPGASRGAAPQGASPAGAAPVEQPAPARQVASTRQAPAGQPGKGGPQGAMPPLRSPEEGGPTGRGEHPAGPRG